MRKRRSSVAAVMEAVRRQEREDQAWPTLGLATHITDLWLMTGAGMLTEHDVTFSFGQFQHLVDSLLLMTGADGLEVAWQYQLYQV